MKTSGLITSAAFALNTAAATAQELPVLDTPAIATQIGQYLIDQCPKSYADAADSQKVSNCIGAHATAEFSIATALEKYMADKHPDVLSHKEFDLNAGCMIPLSSLSGITYEGQKDPSDHEKFIEHPLEQQLFATQNAIRSCEDSVDRVSKDIGEQFQPTARNLVICSINRLMGLNCGQ